MVSLLQLYLGYQHQFQLSPETGLDHFPLERVVEVHMAGGSKRLIDEPKSATGSNVTSKPLEIIEDDHSPSILSETWDILNAAGPHLHNLRAVVFECERISAI